MLHEPSRHEALQSIQWDEGRVRETIAWIVRETEASFDPEHYWPVHPLDAEADESPKKPMLPLYFGSCGVLWALHYLGTVGTALPLIRGRHLLDPAEWAFWENEIVNLVERTADWEEGLVNWRAFLDMPEGRTQKKLMQYCHGAPGFVVNLAGMPGHQLDPLLAAGAEATWEAGPLNKGSNLCHGTGGNGYAFLKLWRRTGDPIWLERARAFAMHGIAQTEAHAKQYGMLRHSLWTGDPGFAIYLWDCINGGTDFPTLDVFFPVTAG